MDKAIINYENLLGDGGAERYDILLQNINDNELDRARKNDENKKEIKEFIHELNVTSRDEFSDYCATVINSDSIEKKLKSQKIKNKKEDIECFASQLQDEIQNKCERILETKVTDLSDAVEKYIAKYSNDIQVAFEKSKVDTDFDAGYAFASSLAKIGVVGGLGAYVAGNAAFLLGSMSFILGVGGDIALGALAFGPIGVVAGLAITAAIGIFKAFGGGWERNVAKKIVKSYEENKVFDSYRQSIDEYWNNTEMAFDKAAKSMEDEWDRYVKTIEETVNNSENIKEKIDILKGIMSFFEHIPLN